jgi:hypothetical protein
MALGIGQFELPQGLTDWGLGISLAVLTFLGQTFITLALKHEQSGVVSLGKWKILHINLVLSNVIIPFPIKLN